MIEDTNNPPSDNNMWPSLVKSSDKNNFSLQGASCSEVNFRIKDMTAGASKPNLA